MNCPDCGAANPADANYCGDCGGRLGAAAPVGQAPVATAGASWDAVFKWIGVGVVGLFVLGLLAGF